MAFDDFLDLTRLFQDVLSAQILSQLTTFLLYAPRLKNDILLAQESNWPAEIAPWILPESVTTLLSNLCGINEENVDKLWSHLKDTIWNHHQRAEEIEMRFKLYGKSLGYGMAIYHHLSNAHEEIFAVSLYPPIIYCSDTECNRQGKGLKLQKADQTRAVIYTLDKGVCPAWVIRLQCEGKPRLDENTNIS
jgi:hypothetical protein